MSGQSLNLKVQKAFDKVAQKVGYNFLVYRSLDYLNPIQPKNYFSSVNLAYSLDTNFTKQQGYSFNLYNLFVDTTKFKPGDIFVNDSLSKRFTLVANDPIATPQGIQSINKISIYRPTYNSTGGFSAKREEIYTYIPAQIMSTSSTQTQGNASGMTSIKAPIQEWDIWVWLPIGLIKPRDIIVDDMGNDMAITSIEPYDSLGYKLHTQSTKL